MVGYWLTWCRFKLDWPLPFQPDKSRPRSKTWPARKPYFKKGTLCENDRKWVKADFYGRIRENLTYFPTNPTMGFPVVWFLNAVKFEQLVKCTWNPPNQFKTVRKRFKWPLYVRYLRTAESFRILKELCRNPRTTESVRIFKGWCRDLQTAESVR